MNSLSFTLIYCEFTVCFGNSPWTHYLFREFTMNPLSISRIHCESTIHFAKIVWIYYLFADLLWIHYLFHEFTINSLSISRIRNILSIFWIHFQISVSRTRYLSRENKMKTQSVSQFHWIDHEYTFYFANKLWKYFVFREFTNEFPFFFTNSLSISPIHYLFREYSMNSQSILQIHYKFTIYFVNIL